MTIGLCGASGRIGWPLFQYLKRKGHAVLGTYCNNSRCNSIGSQLSRYDLREDAIDFFDKCDCVILAAAYCNTPFCEKNQWEAYWLNVYRTKQLLSHLSDIRMPTLFISSVAAVENLDTVYGRYKLLVERYIKSAGLKVAYIRPGKTGPNNVGELCEKIYGIIEPWSTVRLISGGAVYHG